MRINKFIAQSSQLSRRSADEVLAAGRVKINGRTAGIGETVEDGDQVTLNDRVLILPPVFSYVMYHKPTGCVVSRRAQGGDISVYGLLPDKFSRLNPVGRLDKDSSGLLLLSDDGDFVNAAAHPSAGKRKRYEVTLDQAPDTNTLTRLKRPVRLEDGPSRLTLISHTGPDLTVELEEGRNRQIRRTFTALGREVIRLKRTRFGELELGNLTQGEWVILTEKPTL